MEMVVGGFIMNIEITKEQFEKLFNTTAMETCENPLEQYTTVLEGLTDDEKKNPICREAIAMSIAQSNAILVTKRVLTKLLFENSR